MSGEKQLSDLRSDGLLIGQSATDTVGFFGTDPTAQRTGAVQGIITYSIVTISSGFGFGTSDTMISFMNMILEMRATLAALGIFKGSA